MSKPRSFRARITSARTTPIPRYVRREPELAPKPPEPEVEPTRPNPWIAWSYADPLARSAEKYVALTDPSSPPPAEPPIGASTPENLREAWRSIHGDDNEAASWWHTRGAYPAWYRR